MLIFQKIFLDHIKSILFYFYFIWCSSNFGFSCPCKKDKSLFPQVLSFSPLQTFYKFHSQTLCMIINLKLSQYSKIISFLSVSMLSWYFLDLVDSPLWIHDESKLICSFNFELTFPMTWLCFNKCIICLIGCAISTHHWGTTDFNFSVYYNFCNQISMHSWEWLSTQRFSKSLS